MSVPMFTEVARAKVNLYLHVTGRRGDGYHLLDSLIVFADFGDTIEVEAREDLSFEVTGPFAGDVPDGDENLVLRAAQALARAGGVGERGLIRLVKRLPAASGIGGGSADAAATLRALSVLWDLRPADEDLDALALSLGADVPVCLLGRPAFVGGIGEDLGLAPRLPPAWLILVNPGVPVATAEAFRRRVGPYSSSGRFEKVPCDVADLAGILAVRRNDLVQAAVRVAPIIAPMLSLLEGLPGTLLARLSGSGATAYALFKDQASAFAAVETLHTAHPSWWAVAAPIAA